MIILCRLFSGISQVVISSVGKEARMCKGIYKGHVEYKSVVRGLLHGIANMENS